MILNTQESLRIKLLRFMLIIGVVFVHAKGKTSVFAGKAIGVNQISFMADFIINFISNGVARLGVPLFFLISGYLFFWGLEWSKENYFRKLKSRTKSLFIPFVFWNIITLFIIAIAQNIPATQIYFSGTNHQPISSFNSFDYLNAIFGITRHPIAYQFWFIRDLIILIIFIPLLKIFIKTSPIPYLASLFIIWLLDIWPIYAPASVGLLFFSLGIYLGRNKKSLFAFDKYGVPLALIYLTIVTIESLLTNTEITPYLHRVGIVFGVLSALYLSQFLAYYESLKKTILWLSSASFFIFATHEPLLTIVRKLLYKAIAPDTSAMILFLYFATPIMVITLLVIVYRISIKTMPRLTRTVTGGR